MNKFSPALLFLLFIVAVSSLSSCSKNDDDPKSLTLFDKWWYASGETADINISANGDFEQHSGIPTNDSYFGEWIWVDEDSLVIKVDYFPNQGFGQPTIAWLRFSALTNVSTNVEVSLSGDVGSFLGPFEYTTVQ